MKEASPQKDNTVWSHFCEVSKVVRFVDIENRMVVTKGWGEGTKGVV